MKKRLFIFIMLLISCLFVFAACKTTEYKINVAEVTGGRITVSRSNSPAGKTIDVVCTPDDGYALKQGSVCVNGTLINGLSFVMPEEDVEVSATFLKQDYTGTYIRSELTTDSERRNFLFYQFVQLNENTLCVGTSLSNGDFTITENIPYTEDNFTITAVINDESVNINLALSSLTMNNEEYLLSPDLNLDNVTLTGIDENNTSNTSARTDFKSTYTFKEGRLTCKAYKTNGDTQVSESTYRLFGSFLYIEDSDIYNTIRYGLIDDIGLTRFAYTSFFDSICTMGYQLFFEESDNIEFKANGAYICESAIYINSLNTTELLRPYFFSADSDTMSLARISWYRDNNYLLQEDMQLDRMGNVARVECAPSPYAEVEATPFINYFYIISEDMIVSREASRYFIYSFKGNDDFVKGGGALYSNEDSPTASRDEFDDGVLYERYYDKQTHELSSEMRFGTYKFYGDILVVTFENASMKYWIGRISKQNPETSFLGCDYQYSYFTVWYNDKYNLNSDMPVWSDNVGKY